MARHRQFLSLLLLIGALLQVAEAQERKRYLGVNLAGLVDWGSELVFVDLMRTSRDWISHGTNFGPWDTGQPIDTDANGWVRSLQPGQEIGTILMTDENITYPEGRYMVLYDGIGSLRFEWDASVVSQEAGRIELNVVPRSGIHMVITAIDSDDPIRNIRVLMPGYGGVSGEAVFHPSFLENLRPFSLLRFMDWAVTNNSPVVDWQERATLERNTYQTSSGASLEDMIRLANTLEADAWFCMPHLANDAFIRQFAELVRDQLNPDVKVYIEHSNEVWNGIFAASSYAQEQGSALGLSTDPFVAQLRYHSQRSVEIFQIWEEVFGGTDRLVRVLGGWTGFPFVAEQIMDWQSASDHADAYAVAPYFGGSLGSPERAARTQQMSPNQVLDSLAVDLARVLDRDREIKAMAEARGLDLIAYEGGQHLVGFFGVENNEAITALFGDVNRHPRMYDLYQRYLEEWHSFGGAMALFSSISRCSKWGCWGLKEYWDEALNSAHKYRAALNFIDSVTVRREDVETPEEEVSGFHVYPNPFHASATIAYTLSEGGPVQLKVYDLLGREVATLIDGIQAAGTHEVDWVPVSAPAGVYYYRFQGNSVNQQTTGVLVR